jgi:hypothetical protein
MTMSMIIPVIMSVLDQYPGARAKMIAAMEQFQVEQHDRGDAGSSLPGDR